MLRSNSKVAVGAEGVRVAEVVDLDRVIGHELDGQKRVDAPYVASQVPHRIAHRGEVDRRGHAGEVLMHHAGGGESDLAVRLRGRLPVRERFDVGRANGEPVLGAEEVLEEDLERVREPFDPRELLRDRAQSVDGVLLPADGERPLRTEAIGHCVLLRALVL